MTTLFVRAMNALRDRTEGATAVEYGMLVALIAAVIVGVVVVLGDNIEGAFDEIRDQLEGNGVGVAD